MNVIVHALIQLLVIIIIIIIIVLLLFDFTEQQENYNTNIYECWWGFYFGGNTQEDLGASFFLKNSILYYSF